MDSIFIFGKIRLKSGPANFFREASVKYREIFAMIPFRDFSTGCGSPELSLAASAGRPRDPLGCGFRHTDKDSFNVAGVVIPRTNRGIRNPLIVKSSWEYRFLPSSISISSSGRGGVLTAVGGEDDISLFKKYKIDTINQFLRSSF
jgi:hypothetical protein